VISNEMVETACIASIGDQHLWATMPTHAKDIERAKMRCALRAVAPLFNAMVEVGRVTATGGFLEVSLLLGTKLYAQVPK
jgi:hypothetical protein